MAELYRKETEACAFECYSERGILSYFMFRYLPSGNNLAGFLRELSFPADCPNPFSDIDDSEVTTPVIFSELEFGKKDGFGCPDGAVWFERAGRPVMIFLEGKIGESFGQSCRKASYNSTIQGQLELRWRVVSLFKAGSIRQHEGAEYVCETEGYRDKYKGKDPFYDPTERDDGEVLSNNRRLKLTDGVRKVFEYVAKCGMEDIYFLAVTSEPEQNGKKGNPFDTTPEEYLPRFPDRRWQDVKKQFCWIDAAKITG